jgi:hypothetical protein
MLLCDRLAVYIGDGLVDAFIPCDQVLFFVFAFVLVISISAILQQTSCLRIARLHAILFTIMCVVAPILTDVLRLSHASLFVIRAGAFRFIIVHLFQCHRVFNSNTLLQERCLI